VFVCHKKRWSTKNTFQSKEKHFPVKEKFYLVFQESVFSFGYVCFPESSFRETTFQTFMCLFAIRKVGQRKTLSCQKKIWLGF
jgi:hypothetical protein